MKDDSIEGIYDTLKQCALVSKSAGGIGLAVSCIRATGSYIAGVTKILSVSLKANPLFYGRLMVVFAFQTNGKSNGLVPMLRVYNNTARYVDQGGNKVKRFKTKSIMAPNIREAIHIWLLDRDPERLLCTWSRGIPMCLTSWS